MSLRINDEIPNLKVTTDQGELSLHDYIGDSWGILFSHPKDFTPVCTTEFSAVAKLSDEWAKRNTKVIGISVDSAEDHTKWKADIEKFGGSKAGFPIIADTDLKVAKAFDIGKTYEHVTKAEKLVKSQDFLTDFGTMIFQKSYEKAKESLFVQAHGGRNVLVGEDNKSRQYSATCEVSDKGL